MSIESKVVRKLVRYNSYASAAEILFNLGLFSWRLFRTYRERRRERRARHGPNRGTDETTEVLVVKPLRKKNNADTSCTKTNGQSSAGCTVENQGNELNKANEFLDETKTTKNLEARHDSKLIASNNQTNDLTPSACDGQVLRSRATKRDSALNDRDVAIVYDSTSHRFVDTSDLQRSLQDDKPSTSGNREHAPEQNFDAQTDFSTSLESTNSNKGIISDIYSECFICARTLNDPTRPVATLPSCMHPFHKSCLDGVLKWHPKCPVCDYHIFTPV